MLGAAGALLVLALVLVALPAAGASAPAVAGSSVFHGASKNGVYIVRMAALPAVAYDGSVAGYKATQSNKGNKIDPNAPDVTKYVGYLKSQHDASVGNAGGAKLYDYSYSLNGYAAKMSEAQARKASPSQACSRSSPTSSSTWTRSRLRRSSACRSPVARGTSSVASVTPART